MKKYIVITSIYSPTEAVKKFATHDDFQLIVVGDKKTPAEWYADKVDYLSIEKQEALRYELGKVLPYNHYCRKMMGYLKAIEEGAEIIVDTDDDNIPKENWKFPETSGTFDSIEKNLGFINIYELYTNEFIWPRGLPLHLITKKNSLFEKIGRQNCNIGIWQGLADEDPDVDAIYRLTSDKPVYFNDRDPLVLDIGTISPFNTQNTLVRKELFPLLYLPTYVTFRYTDILRGIVAQPIMWQMGYHLGFTNATVVQKRNPHNYMHDFQSEIPMYLTCENVVELVSSSISKTESIENNIYNAYNELFKNNIVVKDELTTLEAWLTDLGKLS